MRILISKESKKELVDYLMKKHKCTSIKNLSLRMNVPLRTFQEWIYNGKRYVPEKIVPKEIVGEFNILDKKNENWGNVKGGKKTYQIILQKYGLDEIRRRQSRGGKNSRKARRKEFFNVSIKDPLFLEFYGILLGDGWIGKYYFKNKVINLIGISGHSKLDRKFFMYCRDNIKKLFNRNAYLKEKSTCNSIELQISHKGLLKFLNKELGFPIGKKVNLQINKKIISLGFDKVKNVIRGIFDTDGSFYLDKTPVGRPYPCISIQMKSPILIKQLYDFLIKEGFRVVYRRDKNMITLKGSRQLKKWMKKIGSSNPKHLDKINALVAQSG